MSQRSKTALTDQEYLKKSQYKTPANLEARINLHKRFGTSPISWHHWVWDQLNFSTGMRVLELGCGLGYFWAENQDRFPDKIDITLADLSNGMVSATRAALDLQQGVSYLIADAQRIPLPYCYFDLVIANHMLYHIPNITTSINEIARVLKPNGMMCAATNGSVHMKELENLAQRFFPDYRGHRMQVRRFSLENAPGILEIEFAEIQVREFLESLEVTEADPLIDYLLSLWGVVDIATEPEVLALREAAEQTIQEKGAFHVTKSQGVVLAWKGKR